MVAALDLWQKWTKHASSASEALDVCQLGNPLLRQIAEPVQNVNDASLQRFIDRLLVLLRDKKGVGIAAPQVGRSLQLLIVASHPNARYPHAPEMEPLVMINPKILSVSDATAKGWEGCLSVPGIRGLVPRHTQIEVSYITRTGEAANTVFTDFVARIFQHEYDHLEGKVFVDRVESTLELVTEAEFQKMEKPS